MNAIISLCHFCEIHGPSVICCTQAFHSPQPNDDSEHLTLIDQSGDRSQRAPPNSWDCLEESWSSVNSKKTSKSAPSSPTSTSPEKPKAESCEACVPFCSARPGFISCDVESGVCYITTHEPRMREVYSIVRQACLRSLSCEMCPGREGPIFFGDDHRSQVLGHAFVIKDRYSRGYTRLFSITVVMMDKIFLLNSWPFLVKHIQLMIDYLKSRASTVYAEDMARCPHRVHRIPDGSTPCTGQNYRLQRGCRVRATRSLVELTNDVLVFERLHRAFTWMLRAGGSRLTEKLLEGPVIDSCIVDGNRAEETEEGFVRVSSPKPAVTVDQTIYHTVHLHDNTSPFTMTQRFKQLRLFAKVLGTEKFHTVAHMILIGEQVVVRCDCKPVIRAILDSLQILLPRGCCRAVNYSNEYLWSFAANFLGVGPLVNVPVDNARCVLLNVTTDAAYDACGLPYMDMLDIGIAGVPYDDAMDIDCSGAPYYESEPVGVPASGPHSILGQHAALASYNDDIVNLAAFKFDVVCTVNDILNQEPTLLENIKKTLLNESLPDAVLQQSLICLKEDWMNKVKRWYMFNKVGSSRSKEETDKFKQIIKVSDSDKMLLKFWMSGLNVEYHLNTNSAAK